jgi:hypothetical protein
MLAFLDSLCGALRARDLPLIRRLLDHPLASALPRGVRDEARAIASGAARSFVAPLQTMRLYHQTAHLLGACSAATGGERGSRPDGEPGVRGQIEMPLERVHAH